MSPPGSSLPPGMELPHVAAPAGQDGVPQGEGCYSCNVNSDGIPLQRPSQQQDRQQYLRVRRSASDEFVDQEVSKVSAFTLNYQNREVILYGEFVVNRL